MTPPRRASGCYLVADYRTGAPVYCYELPLAQRVRLDGMLREATLTLTVAGEVWTCAIHTRQEATR